MNLSDRFALSAAIVDGRVADGFVKQRAERPNALKADFETNISHAEAVDAQQLFRFVDAPLDQVLARRRIKRLAKQPQKMIARQTGLPGNLSEIERLIVTFVDEAARPPKPRAKISVGMLVNFRLLAHRTGI